MKSNVCIPFKDTNHGIGKSDPWVSYHSTTSRQYVCVYRMHDY